MSTIILTRHGLTRANLENRFAGRSNTGLIPEGISQTHDLGDRLARLAPVKVVCGPAARTMESAAIIARHGKIPFISMDAFDEIYLPHWDGLTKDEIKNRYGAEYPTWLATPHLFQIKDCETIASVRARALAGIEALLNAPDKGPVVVVTHLIVVRALLTAAAGRGIDSFRDFKIGNGEFVELEKDEKKGIRLREK